MDGLRARHVVFCMFLPDESVMDSFKHFWKIDLHKFGVFESDPVLPLFFGIFFLMSHALNRFNTPLWKI